MDTYVIATNNAHKLHEIRDILENDRRKFVCQHIKAELLLIQ